MCIERSKYNRDGEGNALLVGFVIVALYPKVRDEGWFKHQVVKLRIFREMNVPFQ